MADVFRRSSFSATLGSSFRLAAGGNETVVLDLTSLTDYAPDAAGPHGGESFSLVFRGPDGRPLDQGTYRLNHDGLGEFDLFIVPIGRDRDGRYYEAIVNRLP